MSWFIELYRAGFVWLFELMGFGGAVVVLSLIVSLLTFPVMALVTKIAARENAYQAVLGRQLAAINGNESQSASERQSAVERLYHRYGYHPVLALRKILPLFVSIPVLMLTYYMLQDVPQLVGVKFLCFNDLSKPDGLLKGINLLPFVMTGINILTIYATPSFTTKDAAQSWFIALLFLVLLYTANTALMVYWTLNQFFNFIRSLYIENWGGAKWLWMNLRAVALLILKEGFTYSINSIITIVRNIGNGKWEVNRNLARSAVVTLVFILLIVFVILQSFLGNRDCFTFTCLELIRALLPLVLICGFGCFSLLFVSRRLFSYGLHVLFLALISYGMLEIGLFSIGLPSLNGNVDEYGIGIRCIWDTTVLICFIIGAVFFYKYLRTRIEKWSVIVFIYGVLILITAAIPRGNCDNNMQDRELIPREDVVKSACYSPMRNVFVFILDSVTTEVVHDVFLCNPQISNMFSNFVNFPNNIGMHIRTIVAVPGLMTGKHFEDPYRIAEYVQTAYGNDAFFNEYINADTGVYINLDLYKEGYTNKRVSFRTETSNDCNVLQQRFVGQLQWNLQEFALFRVMPYVFKRRFLLWIMQNWPAKRSEELISSENTLFAMLKNLPIDSRKKMTLHVHHTIGSHPPFRYDSSGNQPHRVSNDYAAYYENTVYIFKCLGELLLHFRRIGIYDNSTIIIMSDHGISVKNTKLGKNGLCANAHPALLVKVAQKDTFAFREDDAATSHQMIASFIRNLNSNNLTEREMIDTLRMDKSRLYREENEATHQLDDWFVDMNMKVKKVSHKTKLRNIDSLHTVKLGHYYPMGLLEIERPDFISKGTVDTGNDGVDVPYEWGEFYFKVDLPDREYDLELKLGPTWRGTLKVLAGDVESPVLQFKTQDGGVCHLKKVKSDKQGIIKILIKKSDKFWFTVRGVEFRLSP